MSENSRPLTTPKNFRTRKLNQSESQNQLRPLSGFSQTAKNSYQNLNFFKDKTKIKKTPTNISYDKEELYYQNLQLKDKLNILTEERNKLRTQNTSQKKEISKFEKQLEDKIKRQSVSQNDNKQNNLNAIKSSNNIVQFATLNQQENSMTIRLKKQLRDSQKELNDMKNQMEDLKKNHKFTENQELQEELSIYKKLNVELQIKYKQAIQINSQLDQNQENQQGEDQMEKQNKFIQILKKDNVQLAVMLKDLQDEFNKKNNQKARIEDKYKKLLKEHFQLKKLVDQERQQNQLKIESQSNLYGKTQNSKLQNPFMDQISQLKEENQIKMDEIQKISKINKILQEKQKECENQIKQLKTELQTMKQIQDEKQKKYEKEDFITDSQQWKEKYYEIQNKCQYLELQLQSFNDKQNSDIGSKSNKLSLAIEDKDFKYPIVKRKSLKVNSYDLERISRDLALRLMSQRIDIKTALKLLLPDEFTRKNKQSLRDTLNILQAYPFGIENVDDALLMARYLIEDNQNDYILIDENRTQEVAIIRDTFKKLLKNYQLFTFEEEVESRINLSKTLTAYSSSIVDNIKIYIQKKQNLLPGTCNLEEWVKVYEYCEMPISQNELKYFDLYNFSLSKNSDIIYYDQIVRNFNQDKIAKEIGEFKSDLQQEFDQKKQKNNDLLNESINSRIQESLAKQKLLYEQKQKEIEQNAELFRKEEQKQENQKNQSQKNSDTNSQEEYQQDFERVVEEQKNKKQNNQNLENYQQKQIYGNQKLDNSQQQIYEKSEEDDASSKNQFNNLNASSSQKSEQSKCEQKIDLEQQVQNPQLK